MPQLYAAFFFIINCKQIRKYKPDETDDFIVLLIMVGCQKRMTPWFSLAQIHFLIT
jgi:hypothetical protein